MSKNTNQIASDVAKGLGAIAWWNMRDSRITPEKLRLVLSQEGLAIDVPSIDQEATIRREARAFAQGRGNAERYRTEVAYEDDSVIEIGVLHRVKVNEHEIAWNQVDTVAWDKTSSSWLAQGSHDVSAEFVMRAESARTHHDHRFIRPMILQSELTRMSAISLRDQGGFYFVPNQFMSDLQTLERVIGKIGSCEFSVMHISDSSSSAKTAEKATRAHLAGGLAGLQEKLTNWTNSARKPRRDALESALDEFVALKAQAELYSDALQIRLDDLATGIDEAATQARAMLESGDKDSDDRTPPPKVLAIYEALVGGADDVEGVITLDAEVIKAAGLCRSAFEHNAYYAISNAGGKSLMAMGYRGRLVDGVLTVSPLLHVS